MITHAFYEASSCLICLVGGFGGCSEHLAVVEDELFSAGFFFGEAVLNHA
jgi:hypothetical protein